LANGFFRLGGSCVGKGFLCIKVAHEVEDIDHICMGGILRAERNTPNSSWVKEIEQQMREGDLVRSELSMELLQSHISKVLEGGRRKFILDGFSRKVDQAILFEEKVHQPKKFVTRWLTLKDWFVQSSNIFELLKGGYD
jgi:UMP-CMP kinase